MEHKYKNFELKLKADEVGVLEGYFSTYDEEPDSYGDIIKPGAFTETLKKREESGHPFPLCFNHDFSSVIGAVDSVTDTEKGPYIKAHFLDTELANDVRKMLLSGAIYQFSFAYDVIEAERPTKELADKGVDMVLTKLEVFEISVVTVPANQNAVVTEVKAGRRNSTKDESTIKQIISLAESLLVEAEDTQEEEEKPEEEEASKQINEASEESVNDVNSQKGRTESLMERIKTIKEAEHES